MNSTFKKYAYKRQEDTTLPADSGKSVTYIHSVLTFFFIQIFLYFHLSCKYLYIWLMVRKGKYLKISIILVASHLRYVS